MVVTWRPAHSLTGRDARVERGAVEVARARLAHADAAAVLRAGDAEQVAQHPQQRLVGGGVDGGGRAVEGEGEGRHRVAPHPAIGKRRGSRSRSPGRRHWRRPRRRRGSRARPRRRVRRSAASRARRSAAGCRPSARTGSRSSCLRGPRRCRCAGRRCSAIERPSMSTPCICASTPARVDRPADVDRAHALRDPRVAPRSRQSISTRNATTDLYSSWIATPCAVPAGIARPHWPAAATLSSTAADPGATRASGGGTRPGRRAGPGRSRPP